jgi:hypothetical protein
MWRYLAVVDTELLALLTEETRLPPAALPPAALLLDEKLAMLKTRAFRVNFSFPSDGTVMGPYLALLDLTIVDDRLL